MALDYFDLTLNLQTWVDEWYGKPRHDTKLKDADSLQTNRKLQQRILPVNLEVRPAVCVAGFDWSSLQRVKQTVAKILPKTSKIPLESFHIKQPSDLADGELLVPKVIVVANHIVGRLLIDDNDDTGQLDYVYDALCDVGADVMLVYLNLPRAIYPPMKHMIYHPRMIDLVFPEQMVVRHLAEENCLVTIVEGCDFTNMQKNVIKEWLSKPYDKNHPVYKHAEYLTHSMASLVDVEVGFWSDAEVHNNRQQDDEYLPGYQTAVEEHPLANKKRKKSSRLAQFKAKLAKKTQLRRKDYQQFSIDDDIEMSDVEQQRRTSATVYKEYNATYT